MDILQRLIRFLLVVMLSTTPLAASAMSMHENMSVDAKVSMQGPLDAVDCSNLSVQTPVKFVHGDQSHKAPVDDGKTNDHCGACCLSSCAKHLTAVCPCLVQVTHISTRVKLPIPDGQRVTSLKPDPARKPPRT